MDRGAKLAGACRHRIGHIGRRDMAVMEGPEGRHNAEGLEKRMILPDLRRADDLAIVVGEARNPVDMLEPIDLVIREGEAKAPARMPGDGLSRQRFELRIKLRAVDMHFREVEGAVEMRTLSRGVPGGTRGQLALLEEGDVRPALERQVIGEAGAHDAAADDHHASMRIHPFSLCFKPGSKGSPSEYLPSRRALKHAKARRGQMASRQGARRIFLRIGPLGLIDRSAHHWRRGVFKGQERAARRSGLTPSIS